jgi:hypothetical protein
MAQRKLSVSVGNTPAMTVSRGGVKHLKMCYVIKANRIIRYPSGKSRIVYIGTTQKGLHRLAQSAAQRAQPVLGAHGISSFEVFVVSCRSAPNAQTWRLLERALLMTFRDMYGAVPMANKNGMGLHEGDEFTTYFRRWRIKEVLQYI